MIEFRSRSIIRCMSSFNTLTSNCSPYIWSYASCEFFSVRFAWVSGMPSTRSRRKPGSERLTGSRRVWVLDGRRPMELCPRRWIAAKMAASDDDRRSRTWCALGLASSAASSFASPLTPFTSTIASPGRTVRSFAVLLCFSAAPPRMCLTNSTVLASSRCNPRLVPSEVSKVTRKIGRSGRVFFNMSPSIMSASWSRASWMSFSFTRVPARVCRARRIMLKTCMNNESALSAALFTAA
mmetsp:Transcript_88593/g.271190  ORF Transcript_88593/g.271190 Transcript_88593/m.271190 type:complete len:238 (-) Transcript_88593:1829-2542(-)